jgi:uncharacterized membrane protein YeaQ/YmgE (transglycosylase-associated protein family)
MLGTILGLLIIGLVAGFIARAVVPGRQSMSILQTILLGLAGSFVGGFLGRILFGSGDSQSSRPAGLAQSRRRDHARYLPRDQEPVPLRHYHRRLILVTTTPFRPADVPR